MLTLDQTIKHQTDLERFKASISKELAVKLVPLINEVNIALSDIDGTKKSTNDALVAVNKLIDSAFLLIETELLIEIKDWLEAEVAWVSTNEEIELDEDQSNLIVAAVLASLFRGRTLTNWIRGISANAKSVIRTNVLSGLTDNTPLSSILASIRGTKSSGYKNGIWAKVLRELSSTTDTAIQNHSNQAKGKVWSRSEVKKYIWLSVLDSRTTAICRSRSNKIYILGQGPLPPAHFRCFSSDTDVLTKDGWTNWTKVTGSEEFMSVDLDTGNSDFVRAKHLVKYHYQGELDNFTNGNVDILTTPNHSHVVKFRKKQKGRSDAGYWKLVSGEDLPNHDYNFLATIPNWVGKSENLIQIDGLEISSKLFMKFLGIYISEGSCHKYTKNYYRVSIHQEKYFDEMLEVTRECFGDGVKGYKKSGKIVIPRLAEDSDLAKLLVPLGHSHQKHIPEFFKGYDKAHLDLFLHWFAMGGGSFTKPIDCFGYTNKSYRSYSTSSVKLASDLSELILKIGKRPSFSEVQPKPVEHHNGTYTAKYPQWYIRECEGQSHSRDRMTFSKVPYDDFVYDVELEKWHTLVVRRNGRVFVSGNCRSSVMLYTSSLKIPQSYSEWLKTQPRSEVEDILGKAKAAMFLSGKLKLDKYVTPAGRELTLAEIKAKMASGQ